MQETHLTQKDHNLLLKEWNLDYILAGNSTNSRGVAVLLNKTFEYSIKQCIKDPEGRYIILELDITHLRNIFLINIYGPNSDEPAWFLNLFQKVQKISNDNEIWVGDWNVSLTDLDNYNYVKARNTKSNIIINNFIKNNTMSDIWRKQSPDRKRFTWRTERPCKRSRLDYFLLSEDILALNSQSQIHNAYKSDHNIITLSIQKNTQERGKGLWKMNNALLENSEFVKMVKKEIEKDFYQDLYSSKDSTPITNSKYSDWIKNIPRISDEKKIELERPYVIEELEIAIRSSKTNKAPGPDGYSNEFFKFFIEELKHWIFRYFIEGKKRVKCLNYLWKG